MTYASFAASSSLLGQRVIGEADATLVYCSPATAGSAALAAKKTKGVPYALWIQDLWPDSVFASGFLRTGTARLLAEKSLNAFTRRLYKQAEHIAVITPGMRELLTRRGVDGDRIRVIYNWADEEVMKPLTATGALRRKLRIPDSQILLMYAGGHGFAQRLSCWIEAMDHVRDLTEISLVFVGDGPDKANLVALGRNNPQIHFLDAVDRPTIASWIADSDAQVISLADDPLFRVTLPSKTQASLACGKAVLASVAGELATVLEESGAGWASAPEDPLSIARCIRLAFSEGRAGLANRGAKGRAYYERNMSAQSGGDAMADMLISTAKAGRRRVTARNPKA